ncbi:MAG: hypothetical protein HYT08_03535 [Candidatus Levybacteria bacterium]|nr:hypothetical protein [Candidatus Levybacteria bacterium]
MIAVEARPSVFKTEDESLTGNPLAKEIRYFDLNWRREGLPSDWYNLNEIGFSMNGQMNLLQGLDQESKSIWLRQTKRDILGFGLEYLRQGIVFPFEYEVTEVEGERDLIDSEYGKRLLDTVDKKERDGYVLSSLRIIQEHLLKKDGTSATMVSPLGWTGLKTDRGEDILYQDTQVYFLRRKENTIIGTTFRTDFNFAETREAIRILTGKELPENASVMDYIKTLSLEDSSERHEEDIVFDLLSSRKNISGEDKSAYKDKTWRDMFQALKNRNFLYDFDEQVKQMIGEFEDYVVSNNLSKAEIRKALAATILRISKHALFGQDDREYRYLKTAYHRNKDHLDTRTITYGEVFEKVKELPGCAGGGSKTSSIESITDRSISIFEDLGYDFDQPGPCKKCGSDTRCGPCGICKSCDISIRRKEAFKIAA